MNAAVGFAALAGRTLLAVPFVVSGYGKIGAFAATAGMMAGRGLPLAEVMLALAIVIELGGGRCATATDGEAALEILNRVATPPRAILCDIVMPRMDGPTLIKEVRSKQPTMKVIFISGYAEDAFRKRLDENADIHFLPKPFTLKQLAGKVKEVLREGSA